MILTRTLIDLQDRASRGEKKKKKKNGDLELRRKKKNEIVKCEIGEERKSESLNSADFNYFNINNLICGKVSLSILTYHSNSILL